MASVYVETSVFVALVKPRTDPASWYQHEETVAWWEASGRYDLYISQAVLDELRDGIYEGQAKALDIATAIPALDVTEPVASLARFYREQRLMPAKEVGDAVHLAVATVYAVDFLATWNCRHLANVSKMDRIRLVHDRLGLFTPRIVTPASLE